MLPTKHLSTVRENEAVMLYAILKGYKFNVGKIIENSILNSPLTLTGITKVPKKKGREIEAEVV